MKKKYNKRVGTWINTSTPILSAGVCCRFTTNKAVEVEISFNKRFINWFRVCTQLTRRCSQPGFCLSINVIGLKVSLQLFDRRSWDHRTKQLINVPEEPEIEKFRYF